jgi:hypothetical protein
MEVRRRFYVTSVSSATVVLSPEPSITPASTQPGTNVQQITLTTSESTANAAFWGATGTCGRFEVIWRKLS